MSKYDYLKDDWLVAQITGALCDNKSIVEDLDSNEEAPDLVVLSDESTPSPLTVASRREAFSQLSEEAKGLACLLFDAPAEFLDLISYRGCPSQRRLWDYLRSMGWRGKVIKSVFEEFKVFVKEYLI